MDDLRLCPGQVPGTGLVRDYPAPMRLGWWLAGTLAGAPFVARLIGVDTARAAAAALTGPAQDDVRPPPGRLYAAERRGNITWPDLSELARRDDVAVAMCASAKCWWACRTPRARISARGDLTLLGGERDFLHLLPRSILTRWNRRDRQQQSTDSVEKVRQSRMICLRISIPLQVFTWSRVRTENRHLSSPGFVRQRMPRLVEAKRAATGKRDMREQAPAFIGDRSAFNIVRFQLLDCGIDVFAHEIDFVAVVFGDRVNGNLGRRQCEDQPAFASIDCWKTQNIAKKCAVCLGIRAVDDHVCAGNHGSLPP
ncbi:hypothetical protein [Mesorhizobium sp.]|uniref:hypothetical protein n=1 Tax=Mesorhizobium sp. TaxID=1871066 RepID=UPI0025B837A7|nr:hypothetical protein [Mesorhizobium sp.]